MLDTQHEPSGTLNIANGMEIVKGKEFFSDNPESPYRYVEGSENITSERPVSRQELYKAIDDGDVALKHGRIGKANTLGFHNGHTDVTRIRNYGDFETVAHELGHHIDKQFNFSGDQSGVGAPELFANVNKRFGNAYSNLDAKGLLKEGFAEFFRDYTANRARAKADFPQFYKHFEEKLATDTALKDKVDKISRPLHHWYRQAPEERVKGPFPLSVRNLGLLIGSAPEK